MYCWVRYGAAGGNLEGRVAPFPWRQMGSNSTEAHSVMVLSETSGIALFFCARKLRFRPLTSKEGREIEQEETKS